jgi:hypothetical protein
MVRSFLLDLSVAPGDVHDDSLYFDFLYGSVLRVESVA